MKEGHVLEKSNLDNEPKQVVPVTLEAIAQAMRIKYPKLPEDEIVGSDAWKKRVQAGHSLKFLEEIEGAGDNLLLVEVKGQE